MLGIRQLQGVARFGNDADAAPVGIDNVQGCIEQAAACRIAAGMGDFLVAVVEKALAAL